MRGTRRTAAALGFALLLVVGAACGDDDDTGGGGTTTTAGTDVLQEIGEGEGEVNVLAWAYYVEDGSTDPAADWVTGFEADTGCQVNVRTFNTSDEAVQLIKTGEYDGVSASGDASLRLIAGGDVAPINTDLVENYADIAAFLKDAEWNSVDGQMYGIPHAWGANLLMYNTEVVDPAPDSWGAVFDTDSPYSGEITAYDSPIYIADAAVYLMATQPELGIENPYSLDQEQFDAAVALLKDQRTVIGEYWSDYLKYEDAFRNGSLVLGTTWQVIVNTLQGEDPPVPAAAVLPKEGATAWSDTWMMYSDAAHPNCWYMFMDHMVSPETQNTQTQYYGEAPANLAACEIDDTAREHCDTYGADDEAFYSQLHYWTTPTRDCLDGRTDVDCVDYQEWTRAWDDIKG
jgi:putative spermidine/putrescine transport system substrate-binding protein